MTRAMRAAYDIVDAYDHHVDAGDLWSPPLQVWLISVAVNSAIDREEADAQSALLAALLEVDGLALQTTHADRDVTVWLFHAEPEVTCPQCGGRSYGPCMSADDRQVETPGGWIPWTIGCDLCAQTGRVTKSEAAELARHKAQERARHRRDVERRFAWRDTEEKP